MTKEAVFRFRVSMSIFIFGLVVSGATAFPLLTELRILVAAFDSMSIGSGEAAGWLVGWIREVHVGLERTYADYPWIAYGTDWLAFGHLVIALFFIDPLLRPQNSRANIVVGIIACVAVVPLALVCGPIRAIPPFWRLVDSSFGVLGVLPLVYCLRQIPRKAPE